MTVLRRAYVPVLPELDGFDRELLEKLRAQDPGSKAGKQIGGQLNRALKRLNLDPIDIKASPKEALAKIEETEARLKRLAAASPTVDVKIKIDRGLAQLARFKKQLGDVGDGQNAAEQFAVGFSSKIGPLLAKAPIGPAVLAAAVAAAPAVGAVMSAAVIGGAGVGGVIGGLLLVKDDPRVQQASKALGEKLLGDLKADATPFLTPVLQSIGKIEARFGQANSRIQAIFSKSSGFLGPLVDGALNGVDEILRGIQSLITKGKPVIDALGDSFTIIGTSVGNAMETISGGSENAASALTVFAKATGGAIEATGYLVRGLTDLYGIISFIPGKIHDFSVAMGENLGIVEGSGRAAGIAAAETSKMVKSLLTNVEAAAAAARANGLFTATQEDVTAAQKAVKDAQDAYNTSLAELAPQGTRATQIAEGLRKAIQSLTGAQMTAIDANEQYEASWDNLSESIKTNGRSLNIHTAAGRSNRDALESVATATRDAYIADINSGVAIGEATKKHNNRIAALKEEARRNGLNRTETKKLVDTYGSIPKKKTTDLVVGKMDDVIQALKDLYVFQRSLADGIPIASEIAKLKGEKGPAKRYGGYARGGAYEGRLPGAPSSVDNLTGIGRDGRMFGLAGGEFIVNARQTAKHRAALEDLNAGRNGYATGGYYPVEQRNFRVTTTGQNTRIPSRSEVEAKVILPVPTGGRTSDWIVQAARQIVPGIQVLSKDRPGAITLTGNRSYHAIGRAVDFHWNRKLAEVWNRRYGTRTKELITPWQDLNIQNGRRHAYSDLVFNQHNFAGGNPHDHIAMDDGGFRVLRPGLNVIKNGTGRPEPIAGPAGMAAIGGDIHLHFHGSTITTRQAAQDLVVTAIHDARRARKL
ncbi:hypothetical protein ACFQS1_19680 [Paractinoplanes rhizophilus]|uniref:Uncharacterized protein n=1 Tax=Paractinoplanes rhizophilus TaxID=1416877 RepID=A0ABW2HSR1_9ACTN